MNISLTDKKKSTFRSRNFDSGNMEKVKTTGKWKKKPNEAIKVEPLRYCTWKSKNWNFTGAYIYVPWPQLFYEWN